MDESEARGPLRRRLAWVGVASAAVALLDILALVLILKFWVDVDVYGVATVVVTLFGALELAAELGLSAAIIQRGDHSENQVSTLFWWNVIFGLVVYGVVYACAPLMADLHGHPIIEDLFKVFGLNLVLRAVYSVYQAQLKRQLRFREISLVRIVANLADFAAKVIAAASGLGVWCFVVGHLARSAVFCLGLPIFHRWRPRLVFKPRETKDDLVFGVRYASSELLFQLYSNLDYQIVNVYFGATALGFYRAAYELVLEPVRFISGIVVAVAFPTFSRLQRNLAAVREVLMTFTRQNLIVVLAIVVLVMVSAEDLLAVFFRAEYASAAAAARVLAIVGLFRALSCLGPPLLDGLGHPELTLRYQTTAAFSLCALFVVSAEVLGDQLGYLSLAVAWAVGYPIAFVVLVGLVLGKTRLSPGDPLRHIARIPLSFAVAAVFAVAIRLAAADMAPGVRLALVTVVLAGIGTLSLTTIGGVELRRAKTRVDLRRDEGDSA